MKKSITCICFLFCLGMDSYAKPENIVLVTIDGLRWQEVFQGLDTALVEKEMYTKRRELLKEKFGGESAVSAQRLMPFLHDVIMKKGAVIGNRDAASCARVTNPWYFSYPGYNEILTGFGDPEIDSNSPVPNPNVTFMEWLQNDVNGFSGNVVAFASWDVFPFIFNSERSHIPVNVGKLEGADSEFEKTLNLLQEEIPSPWETVRLDAFTHHFALSALQQEKPRVLYIGYGETDDFAHDGEYDQYILAANRTDRYLQAIWETLQSDEQYRDNSVLFITVDHGRGESPIETWQHHASKASLSGYMEALSTYKDGITGSDAVWMAAIGPGIKNTGLIPTGSDCAGSNQIAATLLTLLGLDYRQYSDKAGDPVEAMLDSKE